MNTLSTTASVLIVDDDPLTRLALSDTLKRIGFSVAEASDGEAGIAAFIETRPDIVLLDMMMPGIDGLEVCRRLRARPEARTVPIVMITGRDDRQSIDRSFQAGATDFIAKPIAWQLLPHRLRFILQSAATLRSLTQSETRMQQAQRLTGMGSFEYLIEKKHFFPSANLPALLGIAGDASTRLRDLKPAFGAENWSRLSALVERAIASGCLENAEIWTLKGRCLRLQLEAVDENGSGVLLLRGGMFDVTDLRSAQAQADWLAQHDPVTGLHNRSAFFSPTLERSAQAAAQAGGSVPILLINIERMRRVRERIGQVEADRMMTEVANRLRKVCAGLNPPPKMGRITTDELVFAFRHTPPVVEMVETGIKAEALATAQQLLDALRRPFNSANQPFHLEPSGGLAFFPQDGDSCETTFKAARAALSMRGEEGRVHCYDAERDRVLARRLLLEEDLRAALAAGQLSVHYQPLVRVKDRRPVGVEALLRWQHPLHGHVSPVEFIPIAEESGQIQEIGAWVLRQACTQAVDWRNDGIELDEMAVNVSGRQLADPGFVGKLETILRETGIEPSRLVIEITESVLVHDDDAAIAQLHKLKALGVRLALDDFGTGFSSMVSLTRLPLDVVKVDRSFVQAAPTERAAAAVVEAILALAGRLGMNTVAEGIEDNSHFDFLQRFGCTTAQGYLFQKPQSASDIARHLRPAPQKPFKVLVIDDSRVLRLMLRTLILAQRPDAQVVEVGDAEDAVAAVEREQPTLITLDINMPKRTGLEIAAELRPAYPTLDIVLLTANFQDYVLDEARRLGLRFMAKPISEQRVAEILAPYGAVQGGVA